MVAVDLVGKRTVHLLLAVGLGWEAARGIWLLLESPRFSWRAPEVRKQMVMSLAVEPGLFRRRFAAAEEKQLALAQKIEPEEKKAVFPVNVQVLGMAAGLSRVILKVAGEEERLYRVGEQVAEGVEVFRVEQDQVLFKHRGGVERVMLAGMAEKDDGKTVRNDGGRSEARKEKKNRSPAEHLEMAKKNWSDESMSVVLGRLRETLRENPERILHWIRLTPAYQEGRFAGFQLSPGREGELFSRFGLRRGDVAVALNGVALTDPLKGMEAVNHLASARMLAVKVLRDGQTHELSFTLE